MSRYTVTTLRDEIDKINGWLEQEGSTKRLITGGRNGYQAVDAYSVDADGKRIGSGVDCNVQCGTSRECGDSAHDFYNAESRRMADSRREAKVEFADKVLYLLKFNFTDVSDLRDWAEKMGLED